MRLAYVTKQRDEQDQMQESEKLKLLYDTQYFKDKVDY